MIAQNILMFALAGHSLLAQAVAPPAPEAKPAPAPPAEKAAQEEAPEPVEQQAPATEAAPETAAEAEETEAPAEAPAAEAENEEEGGAVIDAPVSESANVNASAQEAGAAAEVSDEEAQPAPLNPRPAGEEELFGKHPVENERNLYKPGTGLVISSEDKRFSMGVRLRVQIRDDLEAVQGGETTNVFGIRRARLQFKGNIFSENVKYKAEFAFSPRDLGMKDGVVRNSPLLSWFVELTHLRDLSLRLGQYKLLYSRQRVISSGDQEFVDRALAQGEFNLDRDIGGHFFSEDFLGLGLLRYYTGVTIAEGRDVWEEEVITEGTQGSWQYLGRLEVLPFGDFEDYSEVDFDRDNRVRLSLGAAYAHTENGTKDQGYQGSTFTDGGTVDYENVTADAMLKWAGMTAFGELYYRNGQRGSAAPEVPGPDDVALARKGIGGFFQVGYLLPRLPLGLGARYSALGPGWFDESETSMVDEHEIGGQVGWYMAGHNLKLQADYFHIWSDTAESAADRVRLQLQVAY